MSEPNNPNGDLAARVRDVINDCLQRRATGEDIVDDEIIAAHTELMPKLGEELRNLSCNAALRDKTAPSMPVLAETVSFGGSSTGSGRLEVRCPNCHAPTEVAVDTTLTDLVCSICGSHFSLVDQSKSSRMAPSLVKLGHFELIERVGVGSFGSVWKARDKDLDRTVAIKIPRAGCMTADEQEKFFREARAAAQLRHPNIVSVHEVGRDGESVYIVSDFVRGVTLGDWLTGQQFTNREAAELCVQITNALQHAHDHGVIHRDLKPANIIIDFDGQPHLMDFGIARRESGEITITMDGQVLGTPAYMSPEQAQGEAHTADRRSDIYSLGVILFQLLTGELPFRGNARMLIKQVIQDAPPSPRKLNANVERDLETITLKCLEKDSARRYQTARDLSSDLKCYLSGEPIKARPVSRMEHVWRWCKRHPDVASLSAALLLLLLGLAVGAGIVAAMQARSYRALQNQVAHNLFQRANQEHDAGRIDQGIALLSRSYDFARRADSDTRLQSSIRTLLAGWVEHGGQPVVQNRAVLAATFSPDGETMLIGGHDPQCRASFWDASTLSPLGEPIQHDGAVRAVAYSPDGSLAITGSEDGTAALWDTQSRIAVGKTLLHAQKPSKNLVLGVAFGLEGIVATGGTDGMVRLWQAPDGEPIGNPLHHNGRVSTVAFHPNGHAILTGCYDGTVQLWRLESQDRLGAPFRVKKRPVYAARFSPDGSKILTGCSNGFAQLWDSKTGMPIGELSGHTNEVYSVAFSPDGRSILTGSHDNTAQLWDTKTLKRIGPPLRHGGWVMSVDFSPDGQTLITSGADQTVRLWDIFDSDGRILRHKGNIVGMSFSSNGQFVATIGDDATARIWDAHTAQPLGTPMVHDAPIQTMAISQDGKTLVTGSTDKVLRWNTESGVLLGDPWVSSGEVRKVEFSADGTMLLVYCVNEKNRTVELRGFPQGEARVKPLDFDTNSLLLASSSDKHSIVMGHRYGPLISTARIWRVFPQAAPQHMLKHESLVADAAFSRDGRRIVTGGRDQCVRVWNTRTGDEKIVYKQHNGVVNAVSISDDGGLILSGSDDMTARLWDVRTNSALGSPLQHADRVLKVAITPDSRLAVTICDDGSAYLWDVFTCKLVTQPMLFEIGVVDCDIRPDSSAILFRCVDGSARLYDIPPPVPDKPELIRAWALAHSGFEVDDSFEPRQFSQAEWLNALKELHLLENIGTAGSLR
ncbi:protein kinase domain-containing protein [Bythopirellula goksoeyrii]|nr:protein kinase [Bythopirellula goksoeyrii]